MKKKKFLNFSESIFTPKEWFLSKKGQKEGESGEELCEVTFMKEWVKPLYIGYHQALELPKNLFSVSENGPFENFLRSNSIFI